MYKNILNEGFMKHVLLHYKESGSLQKTAQQMGIAYAKARKILITMNEYQTLFSKRVGDLKESGMSVLEISQIVGASTNRVTAFLPYEKGVYDAPDLSLDARKSKKYRKRIEVVEKNIITKKFEFSTSKNKRLEGDETMEKKEVIEKKNIYPVRLHLELENEGSSQDAKRLLAKYADANKDGSFTRDILIPSDMPLHNLHYVIQRLYGWQNSHLRCFKLEEKDYERLTKGRFKEFTQLVGILFQGFPEDESDAFWDDHFHGKSFKKWLQKRYTGPYEYCGYVEKHQEAKRSIDDIIARYPELAVKEPFRDYFERTKDSNDSLKEKIRILKKAPILELTLDELRNSISFDDSFDRILERLEVVSVLAPKGKGLANYEDLGKRLLTPRYEMNNDSLSVKEEPEVLPVTHKILYNYDYGDSWVVEITLMNESSDLLNSGEISDDKLKEAETLVVEKHRPVCISKKGHFVLDDVGGMGGFANFISTIYEGDDMEEKKEMLEWAEYLGWSKRKVALNKML